MQRRRVLTYAGGVAVATVLSSAGHAWPDQPMRLVVPFTPAGGPDFIARFVAERLSPRLGQPVVVENLPGASGLVAHQTAARATPDGYTFLFTNTSGMASNPVTFKTLPYDPAKDFTPVAMVVDFGPQMLSVNSEVPVHTVTELIAYAKANPGKLSYAVDVTAGAAPVVARLLNKRANLGMVEVPYRSAAQMAQDVASGTVPILISSMAAANAMVQAGKIRRIALSSSKRFAALPDLPTLGETVPGVGMDGWFVVVAPAGTPAEAVDKLNQAVSEFLKGEDINKRLAGFGLGTSGAGTPQSTGDFIRREQEKWRALAQELNIEKQ